MKNLVIALIIVLSLSACTKHADVKEKPAKSKIEHNEKQSEFSDEFFVVGSDENPFNCMGYEYYLQIGEMIKDINDGVLNEEGMETHINNNFDIHPDLSDDDLQLYKQYFEHAPLNLETLITFETEILNMNEVSDELLKSIAYMKYSFDIPYAVFGGGSNGSSDDPKPFDLCLEDCIRKKLAEIFNDGNWVQKAEFIASAPVAFAWMVASCSWDCA